VTDVLLMSETVCSLTKLSLCYCVTECSGNSFN